MDSIGDFGVIGNVFFETFQKVLRYLLVMTTRDPVQHNGFHVMPHLITLKVLYPILAKLERVQGCENGSKNNKEDESWPHRK